MWINVLYKPDRQTHKSPANANPISLTRNWQDLVDPNVLKPIEATYLTGFQSVFSHNIGQKDKDWF